VNSEQCFGVEIAVEVDGFLAENAEETEQQTRSKDPPLHSLRLRFVAEMLGDIYNFGVARRIFIAKQKERMRDAASLP
jgi:hypothetical protein